MQARCEYCGHSGSMTKEHVWPAGLIKRLQEADPAGQRAFWLARWQRDIPTEPQTRDVCARCNNVTLSSLDSYICHLFETTLHCIVRRGQQVQFTYDYHLLKRWLLKTSFNSARIHRAEDLEALRKLLPYILHQEERIGASVQLFVQLLYPEVIRLHDIDAASGPGEEFLFEPRLNRVGHFLFRVPGVGQKLLRAIHLCSYSFFIAFWPLGSGRAEQQDFEAIFSRTMKGSRVLSASQEMICLDCNGGSAWESFRDSRFAKLDFRG